jgi:hypothetical protein
MSADDSGKNAIAAIRQIYYRASARSIEEDFARAIDLLKSLGTEDERERAAVYMDGLAQMRSEWKRRSPGDGEARRPAESDAGGTEPGRRRRPGKRKPAT